jgi:hypothetical protein
MCGRRLPQRSRYERIFHNHNKQFLIMAAINRHPGSSILKRFALQISRILLLLFLIASCDIIDAPFKENTDNGGPVTGNPIKILLLDFTGHTCKSCPKAHQTIENLKGLYGDRLIPVAFHLGYFARPLSSGKFTTDFRTPEGTLLEGYFDFISFPTGTVQSFSRERLEPYASWPASVATRIAGDSPLKIEIGTEYLPGLHALSAHITASAVNAVSGPLKLAVYLVEDGIIDWQKNEDLDPMDVPDYVHNHLFRTSLNGLWGEPFGTADGIVKGYQGMIHLSKNLDAGWKAENCVIIAFVYQAETMEVVQVESVKVLVR